MSTGNEHGDRHRERVWNALHFRKTDRIPIVGGRIRQIEFLAETAGITPEQLWDNPRKWVYAAARKLGCDLIFGPAIPERDSAIGASSPISTNADFSSPEEVVAWIQRLGPLAEDLRRFDPDRLYASIRSARELEREEAGDLLVIPYGVGRICDYQLYYDLFGMENFLMAMLLYPEDMKILFERSAALKYLENQVIAAVYADLNLPLYAWLGPDICDNKGPMVSPELLQEVYFPYARKSLEPLRDAGIRIIWHCDGNIMPIAEQLVNYVGIDGFQGFQTELGVDIRQLAGMTTLRGEKVILVGGVNNQTLVFGSVAAVEKEVEDMAQLAAERSGILLSVSCSSGPEVKKENLTAMFKAAQRLNG